MIPRIVDLRFEQSLERAGAVKSFRFLPGEKVKFKPGQFAKILFSPLSLADRNLNKYLSFSCAPEEKYLEFTKKLSGSVFSQKLNSLKKGDKIKIQAPLGNCVFGDKDKKIAFLAGGIGITPVISILNYIAKKNIDTEAVLLYSNRDQKFAFKEELDNLGNKFHNIKIIYTVTAAEPGDTGILGGRINRELLIEKIKIPRETVVFIFGPPAFVLAMNQLSKDIGCVQEKIKKEGFIGY